MGKQWYVVFERITPSHHCTLDNYECRLCHSRISMNVTKKLTRASHSNITGTCKYEDGSRCHKICCDHLRQSLQRDESRMEDLLDYLESMHHQSSSKVVVSNEEEDNANSEYEPLPNCDCGWANRRSCRHDDGTICHYVCCPRHRSAKHLREGRHYFTPKPKPKPRLTFVEELRAMLRTRQHHDGLLVPLF